MGSPSTTNGGRQAYNIALGGACTDTNPMTMLYGPRTSTFKQDYPGVGLVGVSLDGRAHQTTFGSITTSYFSPRNFRQP